MLTVDELQHELTAIVGGGGSAEAVSDSHERLRELLRVVWEAIVTQMPNLVLHTRDIVAIEEALK